MNNTPVMTFLWIVLTLSVRPLYAQENSESALDMSHTGLSQSITDVMHTGFLAEPLTPGNPKEKVLLDSMTRHTFVSSDSTWLPDVHYTYTYDAYGKVLTRSYRTWDKQMDAWKNSSRFTYQYDGSLLAVTIRENFNGQEWYYASREAWDYDRHDNPLYEYIYHYDLNPGSGIDDYVNEKKTAFKYNSKGNVEEEKVYMWTGVSWESKYKSDYIYNDAGEPKKQTTWRWNHQQGDWELSYKLEYIYLTNQTEHYSYHYNHSLNRWNSAEHEVYVYNATGALWKQLYQTYNADTRAWDSISWSELFYDEFDNLHATNAYHFGSDHIYMDSLAYNNDYGLEDLVVPWHLGFAPSMFNHQLEKHLTGSYDPGTKSFRPIYLYRYYYTPSMIEGILKRANQEVRVYPNPAKNEVRINHLELSNPAEVRIYDITGKLVATQTLNQTRQISTRELESGLFMLKVTSGEKSFTGKFIKLQNE